LINILSILFYKMDTIFKDTVIRKEIATVLSCLALLAQSSLVGFRLFVRSLIFVIRIWIVLDRRRPENALLRSGHAEELA
jgi:hypothetical protein